MLGFIGLSVRSLNVLCARWGLKSTTCRDQPTKKRWQKSSFSTNLDLLSYRRFAIRWNTISCWSFHLAWLSPPLPRQRRQLRPLRPRQLPGGRPSSRLSVELVSKSVHWQPSCCHCFLIVWLTEFHYTNPWSKYIRSITTIYILLLLQNSKKKRNI